MLCCCVRLPLLSFSAFMIANSVVAAHSEIIVLFGVPRFFIGISSGLVHARIRPDQKLSAFSTVTHSLEGSHSVSRFNVVVLGDGNTDGRGHTRGIPVCQKGNREVWAVDNVVEGLQIMRISSLFINICNLDGIAQRPH